MDNRPDFSNFLAHFTKDTKPSSEDVYPEIQQKSAQERLISILRDKKIKATEMPWTHANAVCFTECPWSSLIAHTKRFRSMVLESLNLRYLLNMEAQSIM